jgi:hypothetical protein
MALAIDLHLEGDGVWPDLAEKQARGQLVHLANDSVLGITALSGGMASGRTSVGIRIDLPDGRVVFAETSLRLFLNAAEALRVRYEE